MATTLKFKSIWYSFFQAQNSMLIQKSIKPLDIDREDRENTKDSSSTALIVSSGDSVDDYRIKREKNNESVRKSRAKNRVKLQECAVRVKELKDESVELNTKLGSLQTELSTLRNLFQYCFSFNSNKMPVKPSEIPTSTLYKMIMQNKTKFMQPVTAAPAVAVTTIPTQQPSIVYNVPASSPVVEDTSRTLVDYADLSSYDQSKLLSLQDIDKAVTQRQDQAAIFDEKDSFFINELKQSLIDFIKYDDTPSASASNDSSPFISSPTTPSTTNNEYLLNENDELMIDNDMNLTAFLDDHDYSIKRAKINL